MKLEQVFSDVFAVSLETIHDNLELKAISTWDSMNHMVLIDRLENAFSIQLTGDEIADMKTVGDARKAIEAHAGKS